jgi:hypothetical protein
MSAEPGTCYLVSETRLRLFSLKTQHCSERRSRTCSQLSWVSCEHHRIIALHGQGLLGHPRLSHPLEGAFLSYCLDDMKLRFAQCSQDLTNRPVFGPVNTSKNLNESNELNGGTVAL